MEQFKKNVELSTQSRGKQVPNSLKDVWDFGDFGDFGDLGDFIFEIFGFF